MTVEERVQAGAQLLDSHLPEWRARVVLDTLDIADWRWCVLGQVFGTYSIGVEELFGDHPDWVDEAIAHGFLHHWENEDPDELTSEWRALLA